MIRRLSPLWATLLCLTVAGVVAGCSYSSSPVALVSIAGHNNHPTWSPDGSEILFDYGRDFPYRSGTLFRVPVSGGPPISVVQTEGFEALEGGVYSPQGDWIAYEMTYPLAALGIYVVRPDGKDQQRVSAHMATPIWSPDGQWIAYVVGVALVRPDGSVEVRSPSVDEGVYIVRPDGSAQTRLTEHADSFSLPTWSPDGTRIAFVSARDGNREVYVVNVDGSGETNLTANPADDYAPGWSPDGGTLVFISDRDGKAEVYTMNVADERQDYRTNTRGGSPVWSPDGKRIAFIGEGWRLGVMNPDGRNRRFIQTPAGCAPDECQWSPDGSWIVFSCEYAGHADRVGTWIYLAPVASSP